MRFMAPLIATLTAAGGVPVAAAQERIAPSNDSAIDQFLTAVPGPGGDERLPRGAEEQAHGVLSSGDRWRLGRLGAEGERAITILERTAPRGGERPAAGSARRDVGGSGSIRRAIAAAAAGRGDGGLGVVLPGVLIALLMGAIVTALARRPDTRAGG